MSFYPLMLESTDPETVRSDVRSGKITKPQPTSKISRSCDHCKLKKVKCDQKKPTCDNCIKYGQNCVYSVMKKPGLRSGYGQQMFERIDELDKYLEESKSKHELENVMLKEKLKSLEDKFDVLERRYSSPSTTPAVPTVLSSALAPSFSLGGGRPQPALPQILMPQPEHLGLAPVFRDNMVAFSPKSPTLIDEFLFPPLAKVDMLVDLHFQNVYPLFAILHPTIDRKRIMDHIDPSNPLLMAVLVSLLQYASDEFSAMEIDGYFKYLKNKIISSCFAVKSLLELKAVALLAFTLYGKSNSHETWSIISLAVGGCTHLGLLKNVPLHADSISTPEEPASLTSSGKEWKSWVDRESVRRLVWEIYKLDKLSSMGSHFMLKLPQEELQCLLPLKSDLWEFKYLYNAELLEKGQERTLRNWKLSSANPELYGSNSYIIEVLNIMGECLRFRRSPMDIKDMESVLSWQLSCYEYDAKIQKWLTSIPEPVAKFLGEGEVGSRKLSMEDVILHSLYHTMIIRLHSPTAFSHFQDKYLISAQTSKARCLKSAQHILNLSEQLPAIFQLPETEFFETVGPYYAFAVWVSGRVILVNAIHTQGQLETEFDDAILVLRKIGRKWECANKYADILDFFKDDTMSIDTASHDGTGDTHFLSNSYSEDAKLIADIKLNSSSLDALLSKKVARYKSAKGNLDDLSIFDWFKLPLNDAFYAQ